MSNQIWAYGHKFDNDDAEHGSGRKIGICLWLEDGTASGKFLIKLSS